jgi:protein TonB
MVLAALPLAAEAAKPPASTPPPTPPMAPAQVLTDAFASSLVDLLCPIGRPVARMADQLRAARPDLSSEGLADLERRLKEAAPELKAACERRARELLAPAEGPVAEYHQHLETALDRDLTPREREELRTFLATPAGRKAEASRRTIDAEAYLASAMWGQRLAPALYDELSMMLRAELGMPLPTAPAAPAPATMGKAKLRNAAALGEGCGSFYPVPSRRLGEEGSVVLDVEVGADGRLHGVMVEASSGFPALDVAAAACIGTLGEFEPSRSNGQPIMTWQRLKWTWRLSN